jgi:23S rRNA (cytosine1962-C5)-methyltransferase
MQSQPLRDALARRAQRARQNKEVCRLVAGRTDDLDGLVLDRLGDFGFGTLSQAKLPVSIADLESLVSKLGLHGLTLRQRQKGGRGEELLHLGEPLPERIELREGRAHVVLRIHPESLSYGLFPDLRRERLALSDQPNPGSVLNLYAYSGLFGIHAALAGAERVIQVDALKSTLAMIRANEEANQIQTTRLCEDALAYCQRAARRDERFDVVIHDPPTFGRTPKGKSRNLKNSLVELLQASMDVVTDGGRLLSVVNTNSISSRHVAEAHRVAAEQAGVRLTKERPLKVAADAPSELKGGWYKLRR